MVTASMLGGHRKSMLCASAWCWMVRATMSRARGVDRLVIGARPVAAAVRRPPVQQLWLPVQPLRDEACETAGDGCGRTREDVEFETGYQRDQSRVGCDRQTDCVNGVSEVVQEEAHVICRDTG